MKYEELRLSDFLKDKIWQKEKLLEMERSKKASLLKKELIKKEPMLDWEKVMDEIVNSVSGLLNIKLTDVLKNAWDKYSEIQQYLDIEKYPGDEMFLIPLVEHTVVSTHHPKIEVTLGEIHITDIDFEAIFKLFLSGIILKISHGEIKGVNVGKCKCKSTFSCEGIVVFEDESSEFVF